MAGPTSSSVLLPLPLPFLCSYSGDMFAVEEVEMGVELEADVGVVEEERGEEWLWRCCCCCRC